MFAAATLELRYVYFLRLRYVLAVYASVILFAALRRDHRC